MPTHIDLYGAENKCPAIVVRYFNDMRILIDKIYY